MIYANYRALSKYMSALPPRGHAWEKRRRAEVREAKEEARSAVEEARISGEGVEVFSISFG